MKTKIDQDENRLTFTARPAFACIVCVVIILMFLNEVLRYIYPDLIYIRSPKLFLAITFFLFFLIVFITVLYAKVFTWESLQSKLGFVRPTLFSLAWSILLGLALVGIARLGVRHLFSTMDLSSTYATNLNASDYKTKPFYFLLLIIIGPLAEEFIFRGFLYRAFRSDYSVVISIGLILMVVFLSHAAVMTGSYLVMTLLFLLNIITCLIREKGHSTWSCVACHAAYNFACFI